MVKGQRFAADRVIGLTLQAMQIHARRSVDELLLLDVSATAEGRGPDLDLVRELSESVFIPLCVGGGVRSLGDIKALLRAGADKVAICAGATPEFVSQAANHFGRQAIVVVIEHDEGLDGDATVRACAAVSAGAGEIVLQSRSRDGMLCGYDLMAVASLAPIVDVPVVVSGGCGTYEHMLQAFKVGADACAAGAMFSFTDAVPRGAAKYLAAHGIPVRL